MVLLCCAAIITLPFAIARADVVSSHDGAGWWRPRWPGTSGVVAFVLLEVVIAAADAVASGLAQTAPTCVTAFASAAAVVVTTILFATQVHAILYRRDLGALRHSFHAVVAKRHLFAIVAVFARLAYVFAFPFAALIALELVASQVIPSRLAWAVACRAAVNTVSMRAALWLLPENNVELGTVILTIAASVIWLTVARLMWRLGGPENRYGA